MNQETDISLIPQLKSRDPFALKALFKHMFKPLRYFAKKLTQDEEQAVIIASETFMKLRLGIIEAGTMEELKSWMYETTRIACLDYLRFGKHNVRPKKGFAYWLCNEEEITQIMYTAELLNDMAKQTV